MASILMDEQMRQLSPIISLFKKEIHKCISYLYIADSELLSRRLALI
jgi:hypothetical protein